MEKTGLKFEMDYPDLTGYNVFDKNGNDVGEVQDMLYDTNTGMVNHAIIGRGWLSSLLGERQVIVPFDRMTVSPTDKTIRLDIDRDELSRFPEWSVSEENLSDRIAGWWRETTRAA
jgi:sporulation protein YlmC with PRC-barrel domain